MVYRECHSQIYYSTNALIHKVFTQNQRYFKISHKIHLDTEDYLSIKSNRYGRAPIDKSIRCRKSLISIKERSIQKITDVLVHKRFIKNNDFLKVGFLRSGESLGRSIS